MFETVLNEDFVWPHLWEDDVRSPIFTFEFHGYDYGAYMFSLPAWIELLVWIVAEACLASLVSVLMYYTVVKQKNSSLAFLMGYGVFLPFWIFAPKFALNELDIRNKVFRFCLCVITPTTAIFRTMAAVSGFTPAHAQRSVRDYAFYFGCPLLLKYDTKSEKYLKVTLSSLVRHLARFLGFLFLTGMFQSMIICNSDYFPALAKLPSYDDGDNKWYSLGAILDWRNQWRDNLVYAIFFQIYLSAYGEGLIFFTALVTGKQPYPIMENPMFESKSPSDFWGRRWNLLIQNCLKNGVYKPVRAQGGSKSLAIAATFVASGLFHEWLLPTVFFDYPNTHGATLVFFAWQALLVAAEALIGHWKVFAHLNETLPAAVRAFLVILLGLPLAHWFCDSYIRSNFFVQGRVTFPCILPLDSTS